MILNALYLASIGASLLFIVWAVYIFAGLYQYSGICAPIGGGC